MKTNGGYLLLELLVSLGVLVIVAAPLLGLFAAAYDAAGRARVRTEAAFLAREKMEEFKGIGNLGVPYSAEEDVSGYSTYLCRVAATVPPGEEGLSLKQVSVTVSWPEDGLFREMQLTTYVYGR